MIQKLPLDTLIPCPILPQRYDWGDLDRLGQSIRAYGDVTTDIKVRPSHVFASKFEVFSGQRRVEAARQQGLKEIRCKILELPDEDVFVHAELDNEFHKEETDLEKAERYEAWKARFDRSYEEIAGLIGKDSQYIRHRTRLLALPKDIREKMCTSAHFTLHKGHLLLEVQDRAQQQALAQAIIDGVSVSDLEARVHPPPPPSKEAQIRQELQKALQRPPEPLEQLAPPPPTPETPSAAPAQKTFPVSTTPTEALTTIDVPDLVRPGDEIRTSYGTGGKVVSVIQHSDGWTITYDEPQAQPKQDGSYREKDLRWINAVEVRDGKLVTPQDQIEVVPPPPIKTPLQDEREFTPTDLAAGLQRVADGLVILFQHDYGWADVFGHVKTEQLPTVDEFLTVFGDVSTLPEEERSHLQAWLGGPPAKPLTKPYPATCPQCHTPLQVMVTGHQIEFVEVFRTKPPASASPLRRTSRT